ncbi:MAG: DUF1858 domain-containing protein [Nanoarchaeota archaeon]
MVFGFFKKLGQVQETKAIVEAPKQELTQEQVQEKIKGALAETKPKKVKYVTKNIVISEMMNENPDLYHALAGVMMSYGLHCVGCSASTTDTIESGAKSHGMSDVEIAELVKEVNQVLDESHPAMQKK